MGIRREASEFSLTAGSSHTIAAAENASAVYCPHLASRRTGGLGGFAGAVLTGGAPCAGTAGTTATAISAFPGI